MYLECPYCHKITKIELRDEEDRISFGDDIITKSEKDGVVGTTQYCNHCSRRFILVPVAEDLIKITACKI